MYIPSESGALKLVAAEYAVPNTVEPVPSLFGHDFHPAPPGVPLLVLHAWFVEVNPNGMFDDWNPNLSCVPENVAAWEAAAAVAQYQDVNQAIADGYARATPCISDPEKGVQGFHYRNAGLIDGTVDHTKPELLMYVPSESGGLKLAAIEYAVPATVQPVPSLFGHDFHPAPPGIPLLVLHAWFVEKNPKGVFVDWNPNLSCSSAQARGAAMDHMAHPISAAAGQRLAGSSIPPSGADVLIALLDESNVEKAVMMSLGFFGRAPPDDAAVSAENDFVAGEAAKFPDRLIGFCGINPLFPGAVVEIGRCLALDGMVGIKLNPPFSGMDLANDDHANALSAVFAEADERGAPVQLHTQTANDPPLAASASSNLAGIIAAYPDVRVNHSHCAGVIDEHTSQLWLGAMRPNPDTAFLDLSICLNQFEDAPFAKREMIVWRLREWGIARLLWSSDHLEVRGPNSPLTPRGALETLSKYPFAPAELDVILNNDGSAWLSGKSEQ